MMIQTVRHVSARLIVKCHKPTFHGLNPDELSQAHVATSRHGYDGYTGLGESFPDGQAFQPGEVLYYSSDVETFTIITPPKNAGYKGAIW